MPDGDGDYNDDVMSKVQTVSNDPLGMSGAGTAIFPKVGRRNVSDPCFPHFQKKIFFSTFSEEKMFSSFFKRHFSQNFCYYMMMRTSSFYTAFLVRFLFIVWVGLDNYEMDCFRRQVSTLLS